MGNTLTIIEESQDAKFLVEYDLEDAKFEKLISKTELRVDLLGGTFKSIIAQVPVEIFTVDLEEDDEHEFPYAVNTNKWVYDGSDVEYDCIDCKEYKNRSAAERNLHKRNLEIRTW